MERKTLAGVHLEAIQFLLKSASSPDWDFGLNAVLREEGRRGRTLHLSGRGHWRSTGEICSQGTFLFPLMGIWGTTSEAISCVCGALEDSRTVTGLVTLEIKAALGFGTIPATWPGGGTRLVGTWMGYQLIIYRSSFSQPPLWLKTKISLEAARLMVDVAQNQFHIFLWARDSVSIIFFASKVSPLISNLWHRSPAPWTACVWGSPYSADVIIAEPCGQECNVLTHPQWCDD